MLVVVDSGRGRRRRLWASVLILALALASLAPYLTSSSELVRLRNALVFLPSSEHDFDWTPEAVPPDFLWETQGPSPEFASAASALGLQAMGSDWERVQAISRHLLSARPQREGPPIQSGLVDTYRRIVDSGEGYCGDYVPVFMGLVLVAGIPVRSWAFSLDGFGGRGHIWVEVWNRDLRRWQLVDIYNNVYFHTGDGVAVSAAEFRRLIVDAPRTMKRAMLHDSALPGYIHEDEMWSYYRRGLDEWWLVWGNNVFSYDRAPTSRFLGPFSLALEQLGSIVIGVYPGTKILETEANVSRVRALRRLRIHVVLAGLAAVIATCVLVSAVAQSMRNRRSVRNG